MLEPDSSGLMEWPLILRHLERRRGLLSGLVLSGGEPCLQPRLPDMAAEARSLGYAVKLDTNGTLPAAIAPVGADYIAMDIKCSLSRYGLLLGLPAKYIVPEAGVSTPSSASSTLGAAVAQSMRIIRGLGCAYEFRITCAPGIFGPEDAEAILPYIDSRDTIWLQPYKPGAVLDPVWAANAGVYEPALMGKLLALLRRAAPKTSIRGM